MSDELDDVLGYEKHLYAGETVEDRLESIQEKLDCIPASNVDAMRYYIFYKEDIALLLALLKNKEAKE